MFGSAAKTKNRRLVSYQYDGALLEEEKDVRRLLRRYHTTTKRTSSSVAPVRLPHGNIVDNAPPVLPGSTTAILTTRRTMVVAIVSVLSIVLLLVVSYNTASSSAPDHTSAMKISSSSLLWGSSSSKAKQQPDAITTTRAENIPPLPHGVNLGSWLSLEDYFYVGDTGAVQVATPDTNTAAICLPPLHAGQQTGAPTWQSETDLLTNMLKSTSTAKALKVFHAHRTSFITEHDLKFLADLGIRHVRVPLSWCLTDHDPDTEITHLNDNNNPNTTALLLKKFTCSDPFYPDVVWPAIPRSLLTRFLRSCTKVGITASLDLHTYPGATSPGTFSGLWPRPPRFWYFDTPHNTTTDVGSSRKKHAKATHHQQSSSSDVGRTLFRDFITWVEGLDEMALRGVLGISPMNEPAHLAGVFANVPSRNFLPPLPADLAKSYLHDLNRQAVFQIPDGPHLRVLLWLRDAVQVFRSSKLPQLGIQLHVNLHESVLQEGVVESTYDKKHTDHLDKETVSSMASMKILAAWWNQTTTMQERHQWALLDVHHYHAWSKACSGAIDGPPSGNYSCGNVHARITALSRCTKWATHVFRAAVNEMCGPGAKLMSGEFSASTHHGVRHACNDIDTLNTTYWMQLKAAEKANVNMYFWSYKMPFGGAFRSAWSFKELMYLLGVTDRPDQSTASCGGHISHVGEVTDDTFPPPNKQRGECLSCT